MMKTRGRKMYELSKPLRFRIERTLPEVIIPERLEVYDIKTDLKVLHEGDLFTLGWPEGSIRFRVG